MLGILLGLLHDVFSHNRHVYRQRDLDRDKSYLETRLTKEGLCFLTKTLPLLDEALVRGLSTGLYVCPDNFRSRGALPLLLRGLHSLVFDEMGRLRPHPDAVAITDLRQIFAFFKKVKTEFPDKVIGKVLDEFVQVDAALPDSFDTAGVVTTNMLDGAARFLSRLFDGFDPHDITPRHGGGAVADRLKPHEKRKPRTLYKSIHNGGYPYYGYLFAGTADLLSRIADFRNLEKVDEGTARIALVPKDSRGPRIISCEPLEFQFFQQGLMRALYEWIGRHPLTRGRVEFDDQTVNQKRALSGSVDGALCTIDMKEASDRVSLALVERIFPPHMVRALTALRTTGTLLPDGRRIPLKKYAPMGSALCFPVESLCFYALAYGLWSSMYTTMDGFSMTVYGDDLVVDARTYDLVLRYFPEVGLMINQKKSFKSGLFRESCGLDAYNGVEVTPIRLRVPISATANSPEDVVSLESTMNQLWNKCYYRAASFVQAHLEGLLKVRLPLKLPESSYLGLSLVRFGFPDEFLRKSRYCRKRCAYLVKGIALSTKTYSVSDSDGLTDEREYFRKLTQGWHPDYTAGEYTARYSIKTKRKWVIAFS